MFDHCDFDQSPSVLHIAILPDLRLSTQTNCLDTRKGAFFSMNTIDSDGSLGSALPPSSQDAHVQEKHVHSFGPSVAGRLSFVSVVTGFDFRIDPGIPQRLGVSKGTGERHDAAKPNSLCNGNDLVDYSASPTAEVGGRKTEVLCWCA